MAGLRATGVTMAVLAVLAAAPAVAQRPVVSSQEVAGDAIMRAALPERPNTAQMEAVDLDGTRIIKGRNARAGELPFQVQLYWLDPDPATGSDEGVPDWQRAHRCGGALIASDWVLTAAHCFFPGRKPAGDAVMEAYPAEWFGVRAGTTGISGTAGQNVPVAAIHIHPGYVPCKGCAPVGGRAVSRAHRAWYSHDIALVRLAQPMDETAMVRPIRLHRPQQDGPLFVGRDVAASGWGLASNDSAVELAALGSVRDQGGNSQIRARPEPILQVAALQMVPCTGEGLLPTHLCAGGRDGADTCMGDSGGPLVLARPDGPVLVGITSRRPIGERLCGQGTTRERVETRYSRVDADHAAWIDGVMSRPR